jgi:hypothetical protein
MNITAANESHRLNNLRCSAISAANSRTAPDVSLFDWSRRGWSASAPDVNPQPADYRMAKRSDLCGSLSSDAKVFDAAFRKAWVARIEDAMVQAFGADWFAEAHKVAA